MRRGKTSATSSTHRKPAALAKRRRPLVLLVDDDADIRDLIRTLLEFSGDFRVAEAATNAEALRIARQRKIDLVISDIVRPGGDGFAFLRTFKRTCPGVPVIIVSGQDASVRRRAKGAFAVLAKGDPVGQVLLKVVTKALART